jgi:hypothetical protein
VKELAEQGVSPARPGSYSPNGGLQRAADEIEKLDRLKASKSISEDEYTRLRGTLVQ